MKLLASGVSSLKNMKIESKNQTKISLELNASKSGSKQPQVGALLDRATLLGAPSSNAYSTNLSTYNRISSMSSKQPKFNAKTQQQMPLKAKKNNQYNPMLIEQQKSIDQTNNGLAKNANQRTGSQEQVNQQALHCRTGDGSLVPAGTAVLPGGTSFNSSQQLKGNFYQT